jgi:hypothetical protein
MMVGIGMLFYIQYSFHVSYMLTDCAETFTLVLVYRYMGMYYHGLLDLSHVNSFLLSTLFKNKSSIIFSF